MKLEMMLLFPAIFYLFLIQDFFHGAKAAFNSGALILNSGDVLEINTTTPSIVNTSCAACTFNALLQNRSSSHGDHLVASITFSGDIEFRSGSTVKVFGKYALSLTSQNGSILIETDINMTCGEEVLDTTCLGGFTQSSSSQSAGLEKKSLFKGLGPGGLTINDPGGPVFQQCMVGSSHGGYAGHSARLKSGQPYDKKNLTSLLGGSGGSCAEVSGFVAGGGAIEFVAEKGCITINASIRASAQTDTGSRKKCSGGSGGLIRIKAKKVDIQRNGRLVVNGGNAHPIVSSASYTLGGGAGGIIQIISPEGSLAAKTSFLGHGNSRCNYGSSAENKLENGYMYLPALDAESGLYKEFPLNASNWSQSSSFTMMSTTSTAKTIQQSSAATDRILPTKSFETNSTIFQLPTSVVSSVRAPTPTPTATPTPEERLMQKVESILNGSKVNQSAIREVLSMHKSLASNVTPTTDFEKLCVDIFKKYEDMVGLMIKCDPGFLENMLQNVTDAASDCIHKKNHAVWKETKTMPDLFQSLEKTFVATARGNCLSEFKYTLTTKNAVAQVVRKRHAADMGKIKIPDYSEIKDDSWSEVSDFVLIPKPANMKAKENYTYVFLLYKDVENGLPNDNTISKNEENWKVSSFVMSCFLMLDGKTVKNLSSPARLTFSTSISESLEKACVYWDVNRTVWSNDSMQELKSNSGPTHTVCQTNHFTSFAVLVKHKRPTLSTTDKLALSIITYIGCGVSTAALTITLIILLSLESLSSERHKIHMNLVFSLLLAQVLFLAGIKETSSKILCKIIAVFLHYFFLTSFTWMLVEGLHLYLKVVRVFKTENVKMLYYYVFGWCFSIIPVTVTAAVNPNSYGNGEICWLSTEDGTVWAFIGPVIAIIAINCFVLFMVVKTVVSSASAVKNSEHAHVKAGIKGLFVLMPILGVGWILGLFIVNENTIVFEYAFAIVNGFQGLLIFFLHCVFNNEVRQAFRRQREKNALSKENDSQYHASFSLSQSKDFGSKKSSSNSVQDTTKARTPFKKKKTPKFVQVEPLSESHGNISESSFQVKRTFQGARLSKLAVKDIGNEISSLNCPILEEEDRAPPKSQRTTTRRKHSRP